MGLYWPVHKTPPLVGIRLNRLLESNDADPVEPGHISARWQLEVLYLGAALPRGPASTGYA